MSGEFLSAAEMAEHLAQHVTDEAFIDRAVRTAFPAWKREVRSSWRLSVRDFQASSSPKPSALEDGWMASERNDKLYHKDMRDGSQRLLKALWHSHQRVMLVHEAHGRKVARP